MRTWSDAFPKGQVRFVCVSVDERAEEVAWEFQRLFFADSDVLNAFIEDEGDFPKFPTQLGCSGLVVLDAEGRFATLRSPAYTQYRDAAFEPVERLLEQLVAYGKPGGEEKRKRKIRDEDAFAVSEERAAVIERPCSDGKCCISGLPSFELPSVGHAGMDAEHAELEDAMRAAAKSRAVSDVDTLRKLFTEHAEREEELMRRSGFRTGGIFSVLESHVADHSSIAEVAAKVAAGADDDRLVPATAVDQLCRRIVEHALTFDMHYKGRLI